MTLESSLFKRRDMGYSCAIKSFIHSFQVSQRHYIERHGIFCKIQSGPNIIRFDSSHYPRSNPSRRGHEVNVLRYGACGRMGPVKLGVSCRSTRHLVQIRHQHKNVGRRGDVSLPCQSTFDILAGDFGQFMAGCIIQVNAIVAGHVDVNVLATVGGRRGALAVRTIDSVGRPKNCRQVFQRKFCR